MYAATAGVVGGGPWGLGLAAAIARTGTRTIVASRRRLGGKLPEGVEQAADVADVGKHARLIVLAVPSDVAREVARTLGDAIDGRHLVVHGIRGLEVSTDASGPRMHPISEVLREETPARRIGVLGGPVLSEDLREGRATALVCASRYPEVNEAITQAFGGPMLRVYASSDLTGVEWASALVGCLAIGVGYAQKIGVSGGALAALVSRGIEEGARVAASVGGAERTLLGMPGYGDLIAAMTQPDRPEIRLGAAIATGATVSEAVGAAGHRVEAVELLPHVAAWIAMRGIRAPIFRALADGVLKGRPSESILHDLMTLPQEKLA